MISNYKNIIEFFNSKEFDSMYYYNGKLGAIYTKEKTEFIIWAPTAKKVKVVLYGKDPYNIESKVEKVKEMCSNGKGLWSLEIKGDLNGEFYNYKVNVDGNENLLVDPYAKAVGVNGQIGMVIDLATTNPDGWYKDKRVKIKSPTDAIIYEAHVRDLTIDESSGVERNLAGKFKGMILPGARVPGTNISTTIDHIKEMGVTHVHLLPIFDYESIDETDLAKPQYNWGYDPKNYNVPEGSYSTNPYDGFSRIKELKEMVQGLHKEGIGVIMDVVYNHTYTLDSNLNLAVPKYYYRQDSNGNYSNGSGCGNETASDRSMFRKFIVDSVVYWAKEYHIDGFRFDLMGLHDIETMKAVREALDRIEKSILLYGEGWTGGATPLKEEIASVKKNTNKYGKSQIAAFSDDARDVVKGHVFYSDKPGFVNGGVALEEGVKFTVVASTNHPQVDCKKSMYSNEFWANEPYQTITYASAHDNYTLWDKLKTACKDSTEEELIRMNKLVAAIILTSQGIAFIHAGEELARTKKEEDGTLVENSYCSSDLVNKIDWTRKAKYSDLLEYYRGLILIRKKFKSFRMESSEHIRSNIHFMTKGKEFNEDNVVAYSIDAFKLDDSVNRIVVVYNGSSKKVDVRLPECGWSIIANEYRAGIDKLGRVDGNIIKVPEKCAYVLVR